MLRRRTVPGTCSMVERKLGHPMQFIACGLWMTTRFGLSLKVCDRSPFIVPTKWIVRQSDFGRQSFDTIWHFDDLHSRQREVTEITKLYIIGLSTIDPAVYRCAIGNRQQCLYTQFRLRKWCIAQHGSMSVPASCCEAIY